MNLVPYNTPCPIPTRNAAISQPKAHFARERHTRSIMQLSPAISPARIDRRRRIVPWFNRLLVKQIRG
jgi:hypothetical protein